MISALAAIPSPSTNEVELGPFALHAYGASFALALGVAMWIAARRWEAQGGSRELVYDVAMWAFPAGLIGGRLYYIATSFSEVPDAWWGPFAIWEGGLGSWGAFSAGVLVAIWRLRRAEVSVSAALDAAAPALLVAHAIGRIGGNYVNQELYGGPSNLPWAVEISPDNRPPEYADVETFHPTTLYEAVWDLSFAAFLVWLGHHKNIRPPGLFALYVTGYSAFRIVEELMRVDPSHYILGLRLNFFVACLVTIAGAVWFAWSQGWLTRRDPAEQRAGP